MDKAPSLQSSWADVPTQALPAALRGSHWKEQVVPGLAEEVAEKKKMPREKLRK